MKIFDYFRLAGAYSLRYSRAWLSNPNPAQLALQLAARVYEKELGVQFARVPRELQESVYINCLIAGRWAASGYPTVTLGHRTAAAFCGTRMRSADAGEYLKPPWPAFCIRLPEGLLTITADDRVYDAEVLLVAALSPHEIKYEETMPQPMDQHRWWFRLAASYNEPVLGPSETFGLYSGLSLWGYNQATQLLGVDTDPSELQYWETEPTLDSDHRSVQLAKALLVSTCMYLGGDPRERAQRLTENGVTIRERKSKFREGDVLPQYTQFEIASSIKVNLCPAVRDYVERGGSSPTVQTHVAGHWKRVAYGPGHANRKMMHIQPYWRGDLDAPISARVK